MDRVDTYVVVENDDEEADDALDDNVGCCFDLGAAAEIRIGRDPHGTPCISVNALFCSSSSSKRMKP